MRFAGPAPALLLAVPLLAGCAAGTRDAPSLLPRAIEARSDAEPQRGTAPTSDDTALDGDIRAKVAAFDASVRAFDGVAATAGRKVTAAQRVARGSDRWLDAQSALSELGQARAGSDAALADMESLAIARGSNGQPPYPALDAAIAKAQAEIDRQASVDAALKTRLPL